MVDRSRVLLANASDRLKGVQLLLEEFDFQADRTIALKANFNSNDPFPASTHLETLQVLARILEEKRSQSNHG